MTSLIRFCETRFGRLFLLLLLVAVVVVVIVVMLLGTACLVTLFTIATAMAALFQFAKGALEFALDERAAASVITLHVFLFTRVTQITVNASAATNTGVISSQTGSCGFALTEFHGRKLGVRIHRGIERRQQVVHHVLELLTAFRHFGKGRSSSGV